MVARVERGAVAIVCLAIAGGSAGAALAGSIAQLLGIAPLVPAVAGIIAGAASTCAALRGRIARQLPEELDGWFERRPKLCWLWLVVAVLAVANTARLDVFAVDPGQEWASAFPMMPESGRHQCLAAYVRAAELAAAGHDDLWVDADYDAKVTGSIVGRYLGDPYEYPPVFAAVPRAAIAATADYQLIRDVWFGISALAFWAAFLAAAIWAGGRAGATALLLAPVIAISFPVTFCLQWGQAHLIVVAAAVAAMVQFARGRTVSGALMLAFATVTKVFPGLLLVHLAMRRQWRAIALTVGAIAAMTAVAALVVGIGPLHAFVTHQLPRMSSGEAFAYTEHNLDNYSLYGLVYKLSVLGVVDADRPAAALLAWVWTAVALALVITGSRRERPRGGEVVLWLGVICLATLRSPFAPQYTGVGTLLLLAFAVGARGWRGWAVAIAWVLLEGWPPVLGEAGNAIVSLPSQLISIAAAILAVWPRKDGA